MGNPSVRFDEGRERVGHWPLRLSAQTSSAYSTTTKRPRQGLVSTLRGREKRKRTRKIGTVYGELFWMQIGFALLN
jgi:hypothetical protein